MTELTLPLPIALRKSLEESSPELLRALLQALVEQLMSAEADARCGAAYGERSPERVNARNGYRGRPWETRLGEIDLQIQKLRKGSHFPDWLRVAVEGLAATTREPTGASDHDLWALVAEREVCG